MQADVKGETRLCLVDAKCGNAKSTNTNEKNGREEIGIKTDKIS